MRGVLSHSPPLSPQKKTKFCPRPRTHIIMCYHTRTRATLSHAFYMAINIIERTEFLREFILFRSHKKELFIFLTFPISNAIFFPVILSCICVSWGIFYAYLCQLN